MWQYLPNYDSPLEADLDDTWQGAIISVDANVLLNLYRYTPRTRDRMLQILEGLRERLYLTDQAMTEFQENRLKVIAQQQRAYDEAIRELQRQLTKTREWMNGQYSRHSGIDVAGLAEILAKTEAEILVNIKKIKAYHPDYYAADPIFERINDIFSGRIGDPYSVSDLIIKQQDARERFNRRQPPGFDDAKKGGTKQFGDPVLWFQLLDMAKRVNLPVLFVTDDRKDDWWQKQDGEVIVPRQELVNEMQMVAGVSFDMHLPEQFMAYAETSLGLSPIRDAIDEVRDISQQIMYSEGRDGSIEHGGGWPGIGMYRQMTQRNVAAALRLGVRDKAEIGSLGATEFRLWAKGRGLSTQASINVLVGYEATQMTVWELRAAIEDQPPERYEGAERQALHDFLTALGHPYTYQLEQTLGRSVVGLSTAEVQAMVRAHLSLGKAGRIE